MITYKDTAAKSEETMAMVYDDILYQIPFMLCLSGYMLAKNIPSYSLTVLTYCQCQTKTFPSRYLSLTREHLHKWKCHCHNPLVLFV